MMNQVSNTTAMVIVAAGRGERAGQADGPKQYRLLAGKSVLQHVLDHVLSYDRIDHVQVVIHRDDFDLYDQAIDDHHKLLPPVTGGDTRQASVLQGLEALNTAGVANVLIHDAARPFIDHALLDRVLEGLSDHPASLPTEPVVDTLKRVDGNGYIADTIPRTGLHRAQTPQGFHYEPILKAHRKAAAGGHSDFTDDSSIAEWCGLKVKNVMGARNNFKLTTPDDFKEARRQMQVSVPDIRVGHGYDTHQLVAGDSVWLCGVNIPHSAKLSGHSDADVGLHALTDALLSTIADGDIGSHFPPSDPQWKDARSDQFLKHAVDRVQGAGGTITHMDVTILCEAPKIGPYRDAMRGAMATISGVDIARISVKATTNERIGFIGREEGIVALATATVVIGSKS